MKRSTGTSDNNGKLIHEGDSVICSDPIFAEPKQFVVKWDETSMKFNLPTDPRMLSHCTIKES